MEHEHDWKPFTVTTSMTLQYKDVHFCKGCNTFKARTEDGDWAIVG